MFKPILIKSAHADKEIEVCRGDVVRIKGTDTRMTVELLLLNATRSIECVWFDTMNRLQRDAFRPDTLEWMRR